MRPWIITFIAGAWRWLAHANLKPLALMAPSPPA